MINTSEFYNQLASRGIEFFCGVPDSLLKDICAFIADNVDGDKHVITANEGGAVGLAVGYYLASKKVPLVYMQNSGLGNSINPLLSIADNKVYGVPMVLLIGWRGEPGEKDEPQHVRQGEINENLLKAMKIPYSILDATSQVDVVLDEAIKKAKKKKKPYALLVRKNTFEKYSLKEAINSTFEFNREEAVKLIIDTLESDDIVVSTTGKTSREVFEYREELGHGHEKDFLTVGAMGHTSAIAMGISKVIKERDVFCLDGDGSVIMHMGTLGINGMARDIHNFKHIVINNGAHDSVGGQPTVGFEIDFVQIADSCGYTWTNSVSEKEEIKSALKAFKQHKGRAFLEIKVNKGARADLGRPTNSPKQNKRGFQEFLMQ